MSKTKYLLIDIEWNQIENFFDIDSCEIVQIAGIGCSDDYSINKRFFRNVQPNNLEVITKKTYKLLKISEKILTQAKPLDIVMESFFETFSNYEVVIVWNRDAYDLLKYKISCLGYTMPKHNLVVMQELIGDITRDHLYKIGFENALKITRVSYNKKLFHCAKHDVKYLQLLYREICKIYESECGIADEECYSSVRSGILHNAGCRYLENVSEDNLIVVNRNEIFSGSRICKCCTKKGGFRKLAWKEKKKRAPIRIAPSFEDEYIYAVCNHFDVECQIGNGIIFVNTGISSWRIYHDEEKVKDVFHENYRIKKDEFSKKKKCNEGYHKQDVKAESLYEVVRYIESHDRYFFRNRYKNKSRIDLLFEQLERERKVVL